MPRAMRTVELSPKEEVGPGQWRKTRDYGLAKKRSGAHGAPLWA